MAPAVLLVLLHAASVAGFSTFAGSCKHASVNHGLDKFAAQECACSDTPWGWGAVGDGGHALSLSNPGVNVAGATVTVSLSGAAEYKGLLLFAEVDGRPVGTWGKDLPEGVQAHPHCKRAVTHDTYHVGGKQRDDIPWVVPDDLADGAEVVFRATVVRDYATWFAFERTFVVGSDDGGDGTPSLVRAEASAPAALEEGDSEAAAQGVPVADGTPEDKDEDEDEENEDLTDGAGPAPHAGATDLVALRVRKRQLRLLHGVLMAVAWLVAAPAGAIAARYFKHLGALWFDAHRVLQGVAVGATLFGGAIALGILHPTLLGMGPHGKMGTFVLALTCLQPAVAFFRPAKTAANRPAWKQLHASIGWASIVCGAYNCFVGARLMSLKEGDSKMRWYAVLSLLALTPLLGAAFFGQTRRRSVLPFSFAAAKSRDH